MLQKTEFLLYKDVGAPANPTYDVTALASIAGISGEVKMLVISGAANSSFQDQAGTVAVGTTETPILTQAATLPAGDNLVLAAVQLINTTGSRPTIASGNLKLKKGASILASNQFIIALGKVAKGAADDGFLLLYKDVGSSANPTYTITGQADLTGDGAEVKILVINGLTSAFLPTTGSIAIGTTMTTIGTLATTFPASEQVVISTDQFNNTNGMQRNIVAGNEKLVIVGAGSPSSQNQFTINICGSDTECTDYAGGQLLRVPSGGANPSFRTQAQASAPRINGESKMIAISLGGQTSFQLVDWREVFP
jgi:hypothetical protein